MLALGVQQSDSVLYILFQILFPFRLLRDIEQSFLCYTVGPCWLSILNIAVCTCLIPVFKGVFSLQGRPMQTSDC